MYPNEIYARAFLKISFSKVPAQSVMRFLSSAARARPQRTHRAYFGSYTCQNLIESRSNVFLASVISTAPPRPLSETLKMSHRILCRTIRRELTTAIGINVQIVL